MRRNIVSNSRVDISIKNQFDASRSFCSRSSFPFELIQMMMIVIIMILIVIRCFCFNHSLKCFFFFLNETTAIIISATTIFVIFSFFKIVVIGHERCTSLICHQHLQHIQIVHLFSNLNFSLHIIILFLIPIRKFLSRFGVCSNSLELCRKEK